MCKIIYEENVENEYFVSENIKELNLINMIKNKNKYLNETYHNLIKDT